jgi:hypothetical protein
MYYRRCMEPQELVFSVQSAYARLITARNLSVFAADVDLFVLMPGMRVNTTNLSDAAHPLLTDARSTKKRSRGFAKPRLRSVFPAQIAVEPTVLIPSAAAATLKPRQWSSEHRLGA